MASIAFKDLIYQIVIALLLFLVGFLYIYEESDSFRDYNSDITNINGGKFLRLVYIGSSGCSFSNNPKTHQMVKEIKKYMRDYAHQEGYKFLSTGISQDKLASEGVSFLKNTGPYDEIISGASWYNLGISQYVWEKIQGVAATPQILFTVTEFDIIPAGAQIGNIRRDEVLLDRFVGIKAIKELNEISERNDHEELNKLMPSLF